MLYQLFVEDVISACGNYSPGVCSLINEWKSPSYDVVYTICVSDIVSDWYYGNVIPTLYYDTIYVLGPDYTKERLFQLCMRLKLCKSKLYNGNILGQRREAWP